MSAALSASKLCGDAFAYVLFSGMTFNPSGFEGGWAFGFESFVEVLPKVTITDKFPLFVNDSSFEHVFLQLACFSDKGFAV